MKKLSVVPWRVKKKDEAVVVLRPDSSTVALLPGKKPGKDTRIAEAYLIAAAPQLFEACREINSILENALIVTHEGFKINFSDAKKTLTNALLRASGIRKSAQEP
jgi:hypothetical protein